MVQDVGERSLSAAHIWSVARTHMAGLFSAVSGVELVLRERTLLGLTGGPAPDFNMCLADDSENVEALVGDAIGRVRERSLPAVFMLSVDASTRLQPALRKLGLVQVGDAPMMVFSGQIPSLESRYQVDQALEPDMVEVGDLVARAFDLDVAWASRTFASVELIANSSAVSFYLARDEGRAISAVTVTGGGEINGIWSMATDPDLQRRGAGRACLLAAMADRRARGAQVFFLFATPAGKPLYDAVGFTTVETFPVFALDEPGAAERS